MSRTTPLFSVSLSNCKLPRANFYRQLDKEIRNGFNQHNIFIPGDTPILKKRTKSQWRIATENGGNVRCFALELEFNYKDDSETINVYNDTLSGFPESIWDFDIFYSGMLNSKTKRRILYSGSNRKNLNAKQKQKWDYFFRPDFSLVEKQFQDIQARYSRELDIAESKLKSSKSNLYVLVALVAGVFLTGLFKAWSILFLLILVTVVFGIVYLLRLTGDKVSLSQGKLKNEIDVLNSYLSGFDLEKEKLINQLKERKVPNTNEILKWLNEEGKELNAIAKSKYLFEADENIESRILKSSAIYQPGFKSIISKFPKQIDSFYAFRHVEDSLIYSGQFFVFIYLTDNKICISKLFYDFILGKKYKEENKEYHFTDLVGIAINSIIINDPSDEDSDSNEEVSAIWMSFVDSNTMELVIIDDDKSSDIVKRLESGEDKITPFTLDSLEEEEILEEQSLTTMSEAMSIVGWIKDKKRKHSKSS